VLGQLMFARPFADFDPGPAEREAELACAAAAAGDRDRATDFGWASLTVTETRIAGLVRDGLTNREIGTRLFVSPRTVQTHVSHILRKTGLRSRVEIARAVAQS
jgi:DNA-binding CsgD family transcriptional regulator